MDLRSLLTVGAGELLQLHVVVRSSRITAGVHLLGQVINLWAQEAQEATLSTYSAHLS